MFFKFSTSTLIAALALAGIAHAEVTPSEPGPGQVFNAGSTCTVSWEGDKESTTAWKGMAIQLMTGDNFSMVHLTSTSCPVLPHSPTAKNTLECTARIHVLPGMQPLTISSFFPDSHRI